MNYLDRLAAEIQRVVDPEATPPDDDLPLYRLYAVLTLVKGQDVTSEDVHNAWAAWASDHQPESRHLIPFKELSLTTQREDDVYANAIRSVSKHLRLAREELE